VSSPTRCVTSVGSIYSKDFIDYLEGSGITHWIVEAVFGDRQPSVASDDNPRHIKVRCDHEVWLKENLINIAVRHLPHNAKYVMWLDGDIRFERKDWAIETVEALQHYDAVQPFSHVIDYGPDREILQVHKGFAFCYRQGDRLGPNNKLGGWRYGGPYWHPGYAFAFTMDAWNAFGGMIDRAIAGAGDYHMACGLIGKADFSFPGNVHPNYKHMVMEWQRRADHHVRRNIGYVPGTVHHYYHGSKADRRYVERWDILTKNKYDPYTDVYNDRHGILKLPPAHDNRTRAIRDQLQDYFRQRNEDRG
jgi:hypothetical protein